MSNHNITTLVAELLRILAPVKKPGLTSAEISDRMGEQFQKLNIQKAVSNAVARGHLEIHEPDGFRTKRGYTLTAQGRARYKNLDNLIIVDYHPRREKKSRRNKKMAPVAPAVPNNNNKPELPVFISPEANNFADYASAVVAQNAQYRAVLQEVYNTIGKLLNPPATKEKN